MAARDGSGEAGAVPVCYRHSDRETYVACVRCDKPICPDCMKEAAVGFQCLDCVKEGQKAVRPIRMAYSGVQRTNPVATMIRGNVTKVLIGLNILAFLAQGGGTNNAFTLKYAMVGFQVADGQYYRLVTAAFLHASIMHIAFNMFALYQLGTALERVLGTWRYLTIYFLSAIGGNTLSYLHGGNSVFSVGASTGIFGLFGAFYLVSKKLGLDSSQILGLIAINLLITFLIPNIDKFGHLGGLAVGVAVGAIFTRIPSKQAATQVALCAAVFLVLVVGVAVQTGHLHKQRLAAAAIHAVSQR